MRCTRLASTSAFGLLATLSAGCLPYSVGSTARTVAPRHVSYTGSWYVIPNAFESLHGARSGPLQALDFESRRGIDDRSDVGLRVASASGLVVTYKRRLDGASADPGGAVAVMTGGGLVNFGEHALGEVTLLASGPESTRFTTYGGLRVMQVMPLSRDAVHDLPTAGGFVGVRIGRADFGVSPELGVYYDYSALGLRRGDLLLVPSVNVHGREMVRLLRELTRMAW